MDLGELAIGTLVRLERDAIAEIVSPTEDGAWIKVRYVQAPGAYGLVGIEDLCGADEILGLA